MPPVREPRPGGNRTGLGNRGIGNCSADGIAEIDRRTQPCDDPRFRRDVERLHRRGPRPLYEMLAELDRDHLILTAVELKVAKYASRLSPEVLRATGGDQMPPVPPWLVGGPQ
jgi:hypothetical protein